jgi:hypothetical protein
MSVDVDYVANVQRGTGLEPHGTTPIRCSRETDCGVGLTTAFAGGSVFLIDADRGDIFFDVFLLVVLTFRGAFLRVALGTDAFFLFALALLLAFFLFAITASSTLTCMIVAE